MKIKDKLDYPNVFRVEILVTGLSCYCHFIRLARDFLLDACDILHTKKSTQTVHDVVCVKIDGDLGKPTTFGTVISVEY